MNNIAFCVTGHLVSHAINKMSPSQLISRAGKMRERRTGSRQFKRAQRRSAGLGGCLFERPANGPLAICLLALVYTGSTLADATKEFIQETEKTTIHATVVADDLHHPWSLTFLPDGKILITERSGSLFMMNADGSQRTLIGGLPDIEVYGQGGLLDVVIDPDFEKNRTIYLSYAARGKGGIGTEVARARLAGEMLEDVKVIFTLQPKSRRKYHFGSRLVFNDQQELYITLGDRGERSRSQKLDDHAGSVIRINRDGSIPPDNPFVNTHNARAEIFSYGHRNPQGAALHPISRELWIHEHGPQGGDELNIVRKGKNYGWPVITYGVNYGTGTKIGEGTHKAGMEQPIYYWVPSIAPSGMAFYQSDLIPQWKGSLFIGSLKFRLLVRLELDGEKVIHEERMFENQFGRIRGVRVGPQGRIYLLTDEDNGSLIRLDPLKAAQLDDAMP